MAIDPKSRARFNLSRSAILLFDPAPMGLAILAQIVAGLGARQFHRCSTVAEAKNVVTQFELDLVIADGMPESGEGYEFVRWLRREVPEPNRHTPVLLTAGHIMTSDVAKARDCGGHFIVAKPIAPIVMLERIIWISREGRAFLVSDDYVGPDRRSSEAGRPNDLPGRRREDLARQAEMRAASPHEPPSGADASDESPLNAQRKAAS